MKGPERWMVLSAVFTAVVLVVFTLTFTTRGYMIEKTVSILLDREVFIEDVVDIEVGELFSATLRGFQMDHSDARVQADFLLVEINLSDWWSNDEINLTRLLVSDGEVLFKDNERESDATRRPLIPLEFAFQDLSVSYADEDQDWRADIASCTGSGRSNHSLADLECTGELNEASFTVTGHYGLPDDDGLEEPLDINVNWGDLVLTAKGKLDSLFDLTGADLDITIDAPDARPLLYLLGIQELRDGNVNIKAHISDRSVDDNYTFELDGSIAGLSVRMDGKTQHTEQFDSADANFLVSGPSLHEAAALFNELRLAPKAFVASGRFSFNDTTLDVPELNLQLEQGTLNLSVMIPELPDTTGMHLKVQGKQFKPNFVKPIAEACDLPEEPLDISAEITLEEKGQRVFVDARSATFHLNAMGSINESPGDIDLRTSVRGATMATLGQCFDIKLPGIPVRAAAIIMKKGDHITLEKLRMDSDVIGVSGLVNVVLGADITFDTALEIKVPDARELADGLLTSPGPVRAFPFESSLSASGSTQRLVLEHFDIKAGEHSARVSGVIGDTDTLHGLDLEFVASGDDLRYLLDDPQRNTGAAQPYSLDLQIENQLGTWVIEQLKATLAKSSIELTARITGETEYVGSTLQVRASGENIENLLGPWVSHPLPSLPYAISSEVELAEDYLRLENLEAEVGEHEIRGTLFFDKPPNYSKTSGELSLKGPSTTELAGLLGVDYEFLERGYQASFDVDGTRKKLIVENFTMVAGESDLSGKGSYENTTPASLELDLKSKALYLPLFNPELLVEEETTEPPGNDTSVFSSVQLNGDWLNKLEGELEFEAERIWTTSAYTTRLETKMKLDDGELTTKEFEWDGDHSKGELELTLRHAEDQFNLELGVKSSRLPLVWLFAGEALPSEDTSFDAVFDSRGNSVKSLMGNLNGAVVFNGGAGKVEAAKLDALFGDFFHTVTRKMVARDADTRTNIACAAGGMQITDGKAELKPGLVIRTDQVNLYARGVVDFKSEQPDLAFMTKPRKGIGISPAKIIAPRLTVKGTLAKPSFSVDSKRSALSAYAAFVTGGASVLATGLWDRFTSSSDPCGDLYEVARKEIKIPNK